MLRRLEIPGEHRGILGQLVHVDDMDQRAQPVEFVEHPVPLDAFLRAHQSEKAERGQKQRVDRRLDPLDQIPRRRRRRSMWSNGRIVPTRRKIGSSRRNGNDDQAAHPPDRRFERLGRWRAIAPQRDEFPCDVAQPRIGKAFGDSPLERLGRFYDEERV